MSSRISTTIILILRRDVLCKWENNDDNSHLIIPLNDRYVPYFEKTFVPVERELFDTARTVQKELLNIIY